MLEPPNKKYFRLAPGQEVRLRHAYIIKCEHVIQDEEGNIIELRCSYDPDTLGKAPEGRKVKGVIHWVSSEHAHPVKVYQYDRLFNDPNPAREDDFLQFLNQESLQISEGFCEPSIADMDAGDVFQFERLGYYCIRAEKTEGKAAAVHRVVNLRDTWGKIS